MDKLTLAEIKTKIEALSTLLGVELEVDYSVHGSSVTVSIEIPIKPQELPEELKLFAWHPSEVERYMNKGNSDFLTWDGTNYSIAIHNYASSIMNRLPDTIALERAFESCETLEELKAHQRKRIAIWNEQVLTIPKIAAWLADLNENYS